MTQMQFKKLNLELWEILVSSFYPFPKFKPLPARNMNECLSKQNNAL